MYWVRTYVYIAHFYWPKKATKALLHNISRQLHYTKHTNNTHVHTHTHTHTPHTYTLYISAESNLLIRLRPAVDTCAPFPLPWQPHDQEMLLRSGDKKPNLKNAHKSILGLRSVQLHLSCTATHPQISKPFSGFIDSPGKIFT